MEEVIQKQKLFSLNESNNFSLSSVIFLLVSSLVSLFILSVSINLTSSSLLYLGFAVSLFSVLFLFAKPKIWIYSIVLLTGAFSSTTGGGISAIDVIFSIYINVFLYLWIIWAIVIKKYKLIESKPEWILISFIILILTNTLNITYENTEILIWFREYSLLSLILLYFPLKIYLNKRKDIVNLLLTLLVTLIVVDIIQFYLYKKILSNIVYAYQAGTSIRNNLYLFVVGSTFSCLFLFYQKKMSYRVIFATIMIMSLGALASTFARIFWASAFINIFIIFILLNNREKLRFLTYTLVSIFVSYLIASIFFGNIFEFVIFALESRFESTSKGTADISALSRLAEWEVVIGKIKESPFIGNGFGNTFTFKNPITSFMNYSSIIHNSFLHFAFRIGIPLTIMYFSVFFYFYYKAIFLTIKVKDSFFKIIMLGISLSFSTMLITGMFTMTFILRDAIIINAVFYFLITYTDKQYLNNKIS